MTDPSLWSGKELAAAEPQDAFPARYEGKRRRRFTRPASRADVVHGIPVMLVLIAFLTLVGYAGLNGTTVDWVISSVFLAGAAFNTYVMFRAIFLVFVRNVDAPTPESADGEAR